MAIINHNALNNLTFESNRDIKFNSPIPGERGLSVIELITALTLICLCAGLGVTGFQSYRDRALVTDAIRLVTAVFSSARYRSLEENTYVRVRFEKNEFWLETKNNGKWDIGQRFPTSTDAEISMNASPVFYPTGFVSPLCSVDLKTLHYAYRVSISIAGRIKTIRIEDTHNDVN